MNKRLMLEMDYHKVDYGWMPGWLVIDGQRHPLGASGVFPPFRDLLRFVHAIAAGNLPYRFAWNEEGPDVIFRASPTESNAEYFHLQIQREDTTLVDGDFNRQNLVDDLLDGLRDFALDCPEAGTDWEFPYFLIEDFERQRATGFLPNPQHIRAAHYVFEHFDDSGQWAFLPIVTEGAKKLHPAFYLWIGNQRTLYLSMGANPLRWQQWLDLLHKIRSAELPCEIIFDWREPTDALLHELDQPLSFAAYAHGLRAEPEAQPGLFRLIIWPISIDEPQGRPFVHEKLDCHQFSAEFAQALEEFLHTDYQAFIKGSPQAFDLRTLPLDGLA